MSDTSYDDIRNSHKNFDLESDAGEDSGEDSGDSSAPTSTEDDNGAMSLARALEVVRFRRQPVWGEISDMWRSLADDADAKSKSSKLPQHERTASLDRAEGIRSGLAAVGGLFDEATARIAMASTEERLMLGAEGAAIFKHATGDQANPAVAPSAPKMSKTVRHATEQEVAKNTRQVAEFFDREFRGKN
jgi:hypothetical protein